MDQEIIKKLYESILENMELTHNGLITYGYTEEEINYLLSEKIIQETKKGEYFLTKIEKFHKYGISQYIRGNVKKANICYDKCYQMAPNSRKINLQLILRAIKKENYDEAYTIYENMVLHNTSPKYELDNNLYLYLLTLIKPKEEYYEKVRNFKYEDLVYPKSIHNKDENLVRTAIYQNKFLYACNLTNDILSKKITEYSLKDELIKGFLSKVINIEKEYKKELLLLAKQQQYNIIIKKLTKRSNYKRLSKLENYILSISQIIIDMLNKKEIPDITIESAHFMEDAIAGNNFELALKINRDHLSVINVKNEDDTINVLLVNLIEIINNIKKVQQENTVKQPFNIEKEILISEELANYIACENITLEEATKRIGIKHEQVIMIKLIYIRNYYIEGNNELADQLLENICTTEELNPTIIAFITEIKNNKNNYFTNVKYTRKRIK